jgi:Na+-translocating ferredoxin:NAD+ oxidoreductase RNF subunit RnfB
MTIKAIYDLLPQLNCGRCGFQNCGQFARAVAAGRASPFGCRQWPQVGYRILTVVGNRRPARATKRPPVSRMSVEGLREEMGRLQRRMDELMDRIAVLQSGR